MKVLNVNSSLDPETGGGTAERTFQMSRFMAQRGINCSVLTLDLGSVVSLRELLLPAHLITLPVIWSRYYIPTISFAKIYKAVRDADIIHLMGHWSLLNAFVYVVLRLQKKSYVVCPAGALPKFGRSKFLKSAYNFFIGNRIISNASAWIAITNDEITHFEDYGVDLSRVNVIPNGVSEVQNSSFDEAKFRRRLGLSSAPIILFMGRLNQIKGPDLLLRAFAKIHRHIPDFHLVYAGPDEGMKMKLSSLASDLRVQEKIHFLGYVGGVDKANLYRLATMLVVPSRQEAMSIVALEAGILGTPVLLTDQCGFSALKNISHKLEVSASVEGLADGILGLLASPEGLKEISEKLKEYILDTYRWDILMDKFISLYRGILKAN